MDTIKSSADISRLFASGRRLKTPYLTVIVGKQAHGDEHEGIEQHDLSGRVAFIAGKKSGNSVWRNAAKRRMREICREVGGPWPGYDVIFLAKASLTSASYSKVLNACLRTFRNSDMHVEGTVGE